MNIATAKELIAELAPMLEAGTIEDIEHHIELLSEAATVVAASLHCAELLNESHVEQVKADGGASMIGEHHPECRAAEANDLDETCRVIAALEKTCDSLYYSLRMSEDVGVEESFFEEDERGTGPDGLYPELEARWLEKTPDYMVTAAAKDGDDS